MQYSEPCAGMEGKCINPSMSACFGLMGYESIKCANIGRITLGMRVFNISNR